MFQINKYYYLPRSLGRGIEKEALFGFSQKACFRLKPLLFFLFTHELKLVAIYY